MANRATADGNPTRPDGRRPLRVLVVDEFADAADSLGMLLSLWGFEYRVTYSAAQALALAELFRPDVALVEVLLPGMGGYELGRRLHKAGVTVAVVSGLSGPIHRDRCRRAGLDRVLLKPVPPDDLLELLASVADAACAG